MKSKLSNFENSEIVTNILEDRICQEIDNFQNSNDPEEKLQEVQKVHTPEGGFDSADHKFVRKLFTVFGYELSGNQPAMNHVCVTLSNFLQNIKNEYNDEIAENSGGLNLNAA